MRTRVLVVDRRLATYPIVSFGALGSAVAGQLAGLGSVGRYGLGAAVLVVSVAGALVWSEVLVSGARLDDRSESIDGALTTLGRRQYLRRSYTVIREPVQNSSDIRGYRPCRGRGRTC